MMSYPVSKITKYYTIKKIKKKELSLFEQEQNEQDNILGTIEKLNISFKNKDKAQFIEGLSLLFKEKTKYMTDIPSIKNCKFTRSLSYDDIESSEYEQTFIKKINHSFYYSNSTSDCSTNGNSIQSIISQNLETFQHKLKIMVIGYKQVGKTLMINKIIHNDSSSLDISYNPTRSLDIRNHIINVMGNTVKLELWDTCIEIMSTSIVKTYFKICNGFLLICDPYNQDSITFLEKNLKSIINSSTVQKTIMLIANDIQISNHMSEIENINNKVCYPINKKCKELMDNISLTYDLKFVYLDIKNFNYKNSNFQKFFDFTLIRLPTQVPHKKKIIPDQSSIIKEEEKEKSVLKPIANSFLVNNNDSEDTQDENSLYLKKESLSQKSTKQKCLLF